MLFEEILERFLSEVHDDELRHCGERERVETEMKNGRLVSTWKKVVHSELEEGDESWRSTTSPAVTCCIADARIEESTSPSNCWWEVTIGAAVTFNDSKHQFTSENFKAVLTLLICSPGECAVECHWDRRSWRASRSDLRRSFLQLIRLV